MSAGRIKFFRHFFYHIAYESFQTNQDIKPYLLLPVRRRDIDNHNRKGEQELKDYFE